MLAVRVAGWAPPTSTVAVEADSSAVGAVFSFVKSAVIRISIGSALAKSGDLDAAQANGLDRWPAVEEPPSPPPEGEPAVDVEPLLPAVSAPAPLLLDTVQPGTAPTPACPALDFGLLDV